jgi:hypothetical protein
MLARKIGLAKWQLQVYFQPDEIGADAVTGCIRTSGNSLSWWRCTKSREDVAEVALALACKMDRFEKIDVVTLSDTELEAIGVETQETVGDTPVKELRHRHVDMRYLDLKRLVTLAGTIAPGIRSGDSVTMFTKKELMNLVRDAVSANRVSREDLSEKLRQQLSGRRSTLDRD